MRTRPSDDTLFVLLISPSLRSLSDFLKKKTCEVQAFLKAIQLYRQDKGQYEPWDMLIGSDVRVRSHNRFPAANKRLQDSSPTKE